MDIVAVTTCVNFQDILKHAVHHNSKFFREWLIVTSPEDLTTINYIAELNKDNIKILIYKDFYKNSKFNFGGSRRFAQEYINTTFDSCNVLFLDADIRLPDDFLLKLPSVVEDNTLYGVRSRIDYYTIDDYMNNKNPHIYKFADNFHGFFQLYKQSKTSYKYNNSYDCSACDLAFKKQFSKLINLDISVKHLGQEGVHWGGRKLQYGVF